MQVCTNLYNSPIKNTPLKDFRKHTQFGQLKLTPVLSSGFSRSHNNNELVKSLRSLINLGLGLLEIALKKMLSGGRNENKIKK